MGDGVVCGLAKSLGCCRLCALRLCAERNSQRYKQLEDDVPTNDASNCSVCVGALDGALLQELCTQLVEEMAGFEANQFTLNVQLPSSCLVRERAAWLYATRPPDDPAGESGLNSVVESFEDVVDLKEALRWALIDPVSRETGMTNILEAPLQVNILVKRASLEAEIQELDVLRPLLPLPPKQRKRPYHQGAEEVVDGSKGTGQFGQVSDSTDSIRAVIKALADPQSLQLLVDSILFPPPKPETPSRISGTIEHVPIFLTGSYIKLSRQLPQTAWIIDGVRKCNTSVQEQIEVGVIKAFGADLARFHSAGREDVDVRMLGHGRPFMLELRGVRRGTLPDNKLSEIQAQICESEIVHVRGLRVCDAAYVQALVKEGEDGHIKDYRAVVHLGRDVTQSELDTLSSKCPIELAQLTPLRVLHRRTHAVRQRSIHALRGTCITSRFILLDLTTQAGTYVKEFVHGDFGRTTPSLGDILGCEADILQLDVLGVRPKSESMQPAKVIPLIPE